MTSSPPPTFGNRDPYSTDHITSPPISSAKSSRTARGSRLYSPGLGRAVASSPLARVYPSSLSRKRQRSAESDEPELPRPKRQAIHSIANLGSPAAERERTTLTQSTESDSITAASPRLTNKRDSGFHDAREHLKTDGKEVAIPALHNDSGFHQPADDDGQDKNNTTNHASTDLGQKHARRALPSAPVADMAISEDSSGGSIGDLGSVAETAKVENDHVEASLADDNNIECGSTEDHVEEEASGEDNIECGNAGDHIIDEADTEIVQAGPENERAKESPAGEDNIECGSAEESGIDEAATEVVEEPDTKIDLARSKNERTKESPAGEDNIECGNAEESGIDEADTEVVDEANSEVVNKADTEVVDRADTGEANKADTELANEANTESISVRAANETPQETTPTPKSRLRLATPPTLSAPQRVVLASVLDQTPSTDDEQSADAKEFGVSHISSHRPAADGSDHLELRVHWAAAGATPTWEAEDQVHLGARDAVAEYWSGVDGGRLAVRPYEVFAVRGHEWVGPKGAVGGRAAKGKPKKAPRLSLHLRVEWLGYVEETLEPVTRFSKDQPKLVKRYFETIGGRPQRP